MKLLAHLRTLPRLLTVSGALLAVVLPALPLTLRAQAPGHTDWNAGRDLILNEKPDGGAQESADPNATVPQWSYGYRQGVENTGLTLYLPTEHVNITSDIYAGYEGYGDTARQYGAGVHVGTEPYTFSGLETLAADEIFTSIDDHSTDGNNVIRWTCPADGTYSYRVAWHDLDSRGGDGAAGYVVINGVQKFKGTWPNGSGQGSSTTGTVTLKAGDVFDVLLNANSADSSYDTAGTRIVIAPGSTLPPASISLPLTTSPDNQLLDLGAFAGNATLVLTFTGHGDVVDDRWQVNPDGTLFAPASGAYSFANEGASYPTVNGGDGINHYPGGGAAFDNTSGSYGFAGSTLTDTTAPGTIREGSVVGTFSASPSRGDWFLIGKGTTVTVPPGGAHLYLAVDDIPTGSHDDHGAYTGTLTATGGTPPPIPSDWDAGRDLALNENSNFSNRAANPNGLVPQWSYGYRDAIESASLTLFAPADHLDNFGNQPAEHGFVSNGAGVSVNTGTDPVVFSYCCGDLDPVPPGYMAVDANNPAHVSVVRWTAPAAGNFTYAATWEDIDPHGGNGAGGYVVVNGQKAFGQTWANGSGNGAAAPATAVALQAGDTIDFVLDDNGDGGFDTTRFNATVVPGGTPPPPATPATLAVTDAARASVSDPSGNTAIPGDKLTFTFTVRNTGDAPATNVVAKVGLNGIKFKTASDGGTFDGSFVTWNLGTLAAHGSRALTVTGKLPANFPLDGRTAGFTGSGVTADAPTAAIPAQNNGFYTVRAPYQLDVASDSSVTPGDVLTYHFTFANRSKATANNAYAVVRLPENVKFISANLTDAQGNPIPGQGSRVNGSNDVVFSFGNVPAGFVATFDLSVRIPPGDPAGAAITLLATHVIIDGQGDPNTGTVNGGTSYAEPGQLVTVNDQPPIDPPAVNLEKFVPATPVLTALFTVAPKLATQLQKAFPTVPIFTTNAAGQNVLDTAGIAKLGDALNPNVGLDSETKELTVSAPNNKEGQTFVTFALVYNNVGTGAAEDIVITDRVPAGFEYVPGSAILNGKLGDAVPVSSPDGGRTLLFNLKGKLKGDKTGLLLYRANVTTAALGSKVASTGARLDSSSLLSQTLASPDGPDLLIVGPVHFFLEMTQPTGGTVSVADGAATVYPTVKYNVFYKDDGGQKSKDFQLVSEVPANASFFRAVLLDDQQHERAANAGEFIEQPAVGATTGQVVFHLGKLKPNRSGYVQVEYKPATALLGQQQPALDHHVFVADSSFGVPAVQPGGTRPLTRADGRRPHAASVSSAGTSAQTRPQDPSVPRLFVSKVVPLTVPPTGDFSYLVTIGNLGDFNAGVFVQTAGGPLVPVLGGLVYESLPAGVDFVSIEGGNLTFGPDAKNGIGFTILGLYPHTSYTIKITVRPKAGQTGKTLTSPGTLVVGFDGFAPLFTGPAVTQVTDPKSFSLNLGAFGGAALGTYGFNASAAPDLVKNINTGSTTMLVAGADCLALRNGVTIIPLGNGNLVAAGAGNLVAAGAGNLANTPGVSLVAAGAGNLVAAGAGNLIAVANLISQDGAGLIGAGGQSIHDILQTLISQDGSGIVARKGATLLKGGGLNILDLKGNFIGNLVAAGAGNLIPIDRTPGRLISQDGAGFSAVGVAINTQLITDAGSQFGTGLASLATNTKGSLLANGFGKVLTAGGTNGLVSDNGLGLISDNGLGLVGTPNGAAAISDSGSGLVVNVGAGVINGTGSGLVGQ